MEIRTIEELREKLTEQDNSFRSAPFWAWNDKLEDEELKQQMDEMKTQGVGGLFIHSREGLETPYLSKEWLGHVQTVTEYAKEKEMDLWIYDEDKWPSGMAGGMVTAASDEYAAKALTMEVCSASAAENQDLQMGIFMLEGAEGEYAYQEVTITDREALPAAKYLIFRMESAKSCEWYNGHAPADNLDAKSVKKFMELTHETYKSCFKEQFGTVIKGFFTDEPNVCDFFSTFGKKRPWLPWTGEFTAYFQEKRGYAITKFLPCLFYQTKESGKIRHDYFKTLAERFCDSYFKQLSDWGKQVNLKMTGHLLFENDMGYNTRTSGSVMLPYKYLDIPGIDILGEQTEEILTVKQCSSVANQYGKEHVMSEMYGCTKWELDFEGQKWLGDWQFVMGVNLRCQHLALYSLKGLRKRDYPPVFNYQTSWWKYNKMIEDYFARFAVCTSFGRVVRDILVIHPQSSMWMRAGSWEKEDLSEMEGNMGYTDSRMQELNALGNELNQFIRGMLGIHQDCDLGDELLIEQDGRIEDGKFYIEKAGYRVVVIPKVITLCTATVNLLEQFLEQGGWIVTVGEAPSYLDGLPSDRGRRLYENEHVLCCEDYREAISLLNSVSRRISVINSTYAEDSDILTMLRETDAGVMAVLCNNDREQEHQVAVTLEGIGSIQEYDMLKGTFQEIPAEVMEEANQMKFITVCAKTDTKVFFMDKEKKPISDTAKFAFRHPHAGDSIWMALPPAAKFRRDSPNVLVLDQCSYCLQEDIWSSEMDVWRAQREVRSRLGMRQIYYNGVPQRYGWIDEKSDGEGSFLKQRFHFSVEEVPNHPIYLGIEQAKYFNLTLNGESCSNVPQGYYLDHCINKVRLPQLRAGMNELVLTCHYLNRMELEELYLLGDFAVNCNRGITKEPEMLHFGDWCLQGYPHYAGGIEYCFEINADRISKEPKIMMLGKQKSVVTEVSVNGTTAGIVPWPAADGIDLAPFLKQGKNCLNIKVISTPRNVFGPFHQPYDQCKRISWADFRTEGNSYTKQYVLKPYGLVNQIVILA